MQHVYSLRVTMCIWDQNINFPKEWFYFFKEQMKFPKKQLSQGKI
jgi:hypothetical protein